VRSESVEKTADSAAGVISEGTLYTGSAFGRLLGLGRWGLRNLRSEGLPCRVAGGRVYVLGSEAVRWFESLPAAPRPKRLQRSESEGGNGEN